MRVMVLVKATKDSEAGVMPSTELLAAMGQYNEDLVKAGILLAGEGLKPPSQGKRVALTARAAPSLTALLPRPASWSPVWLWQVKDMAEAVAGEALPQSDAGSERDRNPPGVRGR